MTDVLRIKGKSRINFSDDYIAFDLETTGLDPEWDEIIEIGAIHYINDHEVDRFQTFVQPEREIPMYITALTGITNDMVATAPQIDEVLPSFIEYVSKTILVGHNVNFDINFVYDYWKNLSGMDFSNDFIDTMRIARKLLKDLPHHRLQDLKEYYGIHAETTHRAIADCVATHELLNHLRHDVNLKYESEEAFQRLFIKHYGPKLDISSIRPDDESDFDPENILFGREVVITGTLAKMPRKEALQLVANIGGIPKNSVTKTTGFLVLGNNDYCRTIKGDKSAKQEKAEKLKLAGNDIEILSENVFYDLLGIH